MSDSPAAMNVKMENLVVRSCPCCGASDSHTLIELDVADFTRSNPGYDLHQIRLLGFDEADRFPIVRCAGCAFQYSRYRLTDDLACRLYDQCIDHERSQAKILSPVKRRRLLEVWIKLFGVATSDVDTLNLSVLDFGCGWGDFLATAQSPGVRCVGLEIDPQKVQWAQASGLVVEESKSAVDEHAPFDIVFCDQVLEHVDDPREEIKSLADWLVPGGVAYISVPNCDSSAMQIALDALGHGQLPPKKFNPWEHLNYFTPESLAAMLRDAGLEPLLAPVRHRRGVRRLVRGIMEIAVVRAQCRSRGGTAVFCRNK